MKQFGLIGFPLTHSFSAKYFAQKFEQENIENCRYDNFELPEIKHFDALKKTPNLCGLNVTIPYKQAVMGFLDEVDESAKIIGAVNTIVFKNGKTKGYNTDIYGFENSLKPLLQAQHQKALILGNGGAAAAVKFVLEKLNIHFLFVSRTPKNGQIDYLAVDKKLLENYHILINTTPLGTFPNINTCPDIDYEGLTPQHLLFDLVYNPAETLFMQKGKQKGAITQNGYQMLELQAQKAWEIWMQQA